MIVLLFTCAVAGLISQASAQVKLNAEPIPSAGVYPISQSAVSNRSMYNWGSNQSHWLGYWLVADSLAKEHGKTPSAFYSYLFPDSSAVICDNGCGTTGYHLIGNIFDVNSSVMQRILNYSWSMSYPYWLDSVSIAYFYKRQTAANIVDTLIVYIWDNAVTSDIQTNCYFTGDSALNYGVDTLWTALSSYDSTGANKPKPSPGALRTFKIPLTINDTAVVGGNMAIKSISVNHFAVPAGKILASAFSFKPGYTYAAGDTISKDKNVFAFISDVPNGVGYSPYFNNDWNASGVVQNAVRYNFDTLGYNGHFIPTYAFPPDYRLQQHFITYNIAPLPGGLNDPSFFNGLKLYQNQPNPANHSTLIKYETLSSGIVALDVKDITGRIVMQLNQGIQASGIHSILVDVSNLPKGIYLYTLKAKNESLTGKMVIGE